MASTVTMASHVEAFGGSGYKRTLASGGGVNLPAKRLTRPTSELRAAPTTFPATSARPDQRVNVRIPVTRASYSRLLPGQVAFVNRQFGKYHPGYKSGLGGLTPVASMEEVNDMLAQEGAFLSTTVDTAAATNNLLFKSVETRSVYSHVGKNRERAKAIVFRDNAIDSQHPVMQFALDGLVATRVEEVDDLNTYSSASAQQACIVAVKGPAPMRLAPVPGETHTGISESLLGTRIPAANVFLEPARILAKVYVVLTAVFVDVKDGKRRFKLRYETVSSSNLDVDPVFATGHKLFRKGLRLPNRTTAASPPVSGNRIVLRAFELGAVVDTAFGPAEQPQLTVCVHVTPLERVSISSAGKHVPVAPYELFESKTRAELRVERAKRLKAKGPSRLYRTDPSGKLSVLGARPFVTGTSGGIGAELKGVLTALAELQKKSLERDEQLTKLVKRVFEKGDVAHAAAEAHEKAKKVPPTGPPTAQERSAVDDEIFRSNIASFTDVLYQEILAKFAEFGLPDDEIMREFANEADTKLDVIQDVDSVVNRIGIQTREHEAAYAIAVEAAISIARSVFEAEKGAAEQLRAQENAIEQAQLRVSEIDLQNKRLKTATTNFLQALEKKDEASVLRLKGELDALLERGQRVSANV